MQPTECDFPSFGRAVQFWLKLGLISFGGPASQIAIMYRELVETKRWMDDRHFMSALNFCMLLPGPEAQQLATYLGWRLHGAKGGIVAGTLFVLPSAFVLLGLSWLFMAGNQLWWVKAIFHCLLGAVIAIVLDAIFRIGRRALRSRCLITLAAISFVAIYFFNVSFILIVYCAGIVGWVGNRRWPEQFPTTRSHGKTKDAENVVDVALPSMPPATWIRSIKVIAVCVSLWWVPIVTLGSALGWSSTPAQQGLFFSKAALVTFGGAYAVLPYVAQQAVENYSWLDHTQMMSGLALAESTPGPLIMVLQFVGFVGGWQHPGMLEPWTAALICSAITTWVTFIPSFLFVFLGAPWIESIAKFPRLEATLTAITACVVGVILNLGVKFTMAALWPGRDHLDYFVGIVAVIAFAFIWKLKTPLIQIILATAATGIVWNSF